MSLCRCALSKAKGKVLVSWFPVVLRALISESDEGELSLENAKEEEKKKNDLNSSWTTFSSKDEKERHIGTAVLRFSVFLLFFLSFLDATLEEWSNIPNAVTKRTKSAPSIRRDTSKIKSAVDEWAGSSPQKLSQREKQAKQREKEAEKRRKERVKHVVHAWQDGPPCLHASIDTPPPPAGLFFSSLFIFF
jgi:cytoskeletal protein RodZ